MYAWGYLPLLASDIQISEKTEAGKIVGNTSRFWKGRKLSLKKRLSTCLKHKLYSLSLVMLEESKTK